MPQIYSAILAILLFFSVLPSQAETDITEKKSDQRQQLQSILRELDQATKQRQQQNVRLETLSRQLECNWTLIRAYETCGQLHGNNPDKHLKCSTEAKQNATQCLENNEEK